MKYFDISGDKDKCMWLVPVGLRMLVTYIALPFQIKKVASLPQKSYRLMLQFSVASVLAFLSVLIFQQWEGFQWGFFIVVGIGIFNCAANFFHWTAVASDPAGLSKTYVFTQLDDLITILLGIVFLGEYKVVNMSLSVGIVMVFVAGVLLSLKVIEGKRQFNFTLIKNVLLYSVIWGVAVFSVRLFAVNGMPTFVFVLGWYLGSSIGGFLLHKLSGEGVPALSSDHKRAILWLSLTVFANMFLQTAAYQFAPIVVIQPLFQLGEMILPFLVGIIIFKEAKTFSRYDILGICVGLAGGLLILTGYL